METQLVKYENLHELSFSCSSVTATLWANRR